MWKTDHSPAPQGRPGTRGFALCTAGLILVVAGTFSSANAQILSSEAYGDQMVGGRVRIEWGSTSGMFLGITAGPIVLGGGTREGVATIPGWGGGAGASFSVENETFLANWELVNNSSNFIIRAAVIDLHGSDSLFDNDLGGVLGGTPNGANGRAGVVYLPAFSTAPAHANAFEFDSWLGGLAPNVGDMFWQERIEWNFDIGVGPVFLPGQTFTCENDTDVVPAPGVLAMLGLAGGLMARRRARI